MLNDIDKNILDEEKCIRCVKHPYHISSKNNKLKREAFLPPPEDSRVSVLRYRYCTLDECKKHGKILGNESYVGLACFKKTDVIKMNEDYNKADQNLNKVIANLIYSPIDSDGKYIDLDIVVTKNTPGLPMHADLEYNFFLVKESKIYTKLRKYAQVFSKKVLFIKDEHIESENWDMGDFPI